MLRYVTGCAEGAQESAPAMRSRGSLLVIVLGVTVGVAACGRASEEEINQALGITPTPTLSAAAMATGTAVAEAAAAARATAAASPGAVAVALGDVTRGRRQFTTYCSACHGPGGRGPDLLPPGGAGADVTADTLLPLIREGTGHAVPPGPYPSTLISNSAVRDIAAYIASEAS